MSDLNGQVAFVTGGASGIGRALARALGRRGMRIMLADIDDAGMSTAAVSLAAEAIEAECVHCDVADAESIGNARQAALDRFGSIHWLVNNAGVFCGGGAGSRSLEHWRWAINVNLMSVVSGVELFLPDLRKHPAKACILNTASVAGHVGYANALPYCTTKFAVAGYTESLHAQLAPEGIRVSALCPGFVNTRIAETQRYEQLPDAVSGPLAEAVASGMAPEVVAEFAVEQTLSGHLFIFTHPGTHAEIRNHAERVDQAFARTASSKLLATDPDAQRTASREDTERTVRE